MKLSHISTMTSAQASGNMAPVRPTRRIMVVDVLRGLSVLGILLVNMLSFSGYFYTPTYDMNGVNRLATLLIKFIAQAKFYTLFSFLFGWGMAIQMGRAAERDRPFVPLYVRRLIILLMIGLVHALLIWEGDILVYYAVLGLALLLFRNRSRKTILIAAAVCILVPVLLSTPGPATSIREWHAGLVAPLHQRMMEGHQANVYVEGSFLEATMHRVKAAAFAYAGVINWAPHIFGMFLLGLYVGRRRIFHDVTAHLPLFRRVMWSGLSVGLILNLVWVAASDNPDLVPRAYQELATRGARTIAGSALCLFYIAGIVLLTQRKSWMEWLSPLALVGRTALSNYLFQSIVCTLLFYGYGVGLYRKLGPAITMILTLVLFRAQISLSAWWLERYRFGPAEWLWRSLTYGQGRSGWAAQPWRAEPGHSLRAAGPSADIAEGPAALLRGAMLVLQRLAFVAAVSFAIVYFCMLGVRLSGNSRLPVGQERRSVWDVAGPALDETIGFFEDLPRGELGQVAPAVSGRAAQSTMHVLAAAYGDSGRLLIVAIGLACAIGIAAGTLAAAWRRSALSLPMLTLTVVGISIPSFFLALLLQIGSIKFYQLTGIRVVLLGPHLPDAKSLLPKLALPALVLVSRPLAHITRVTFISLSDVLEQDYVRTARAKGLRDILVFWNHVVRNAGVSILTAVVVSFRFALGSLPVVEVFFDWPGLGVTMLNGIFQRHASLVAGAALGLGVTFLLINMGLDQLYRFIDPRLRGQNNGGGR